MRRVFVYRVKFMGTVRTSERGSGGYVRGTETRVLTEELVIATDPVNAMELLREASTARGEFLHLVEIHSVEGIGTAWIRP